MHQQICATQTTYHDYTMLSHLQLLTTLRVPTLMLSTETRISGHTRLHFAIAVAMAGLHYIRHIISTRVSEHNGFTTACPYSCEIRTSTCYGYPHNSCLLLTIDPSLQRGIASSQGSTRSCFMPVSYFLFPYDKYYKLVLQICQ